jgi:hypothetical protein
MVESRDMAMDLAYIRCWADFTAHFPAWTFERYLRHVEQTVAPEEVQGPRQARTFSVEQRSVLPSLGETLARARRESTDTPVGG